jgi:hypothetical protein
MEIAPSGQAPTQMPQPSHLSTSIVINTSHLSRAFPYCLLLSSQTGICTTSSASRLNPTKGEWCESCPRHSPLWIRGPVWLLFVP